MVGLGKKTSPNSALFPSHDHGGGITIVTSIQPTAILDPLTGIVTSIIATSIPNINGQGVTGLNWDLSSYQVQPSSIIVGAGFINPIKQTFASTFKLLCMADSHENDPVSAIRIETPSATEYIYYSSIEEQYECDDINGDEVYRALFSIDIDPSEYTSGEVIVSGTAITASGIERPFPYSFSFFANSDGESGGASENLELYMFSPTNPAYQGESGDGPTAFTSFDGLFNYYSGTDLAEANVYFLDSGPFTWSASPDAAEVLESTRWVHFQPSPSGTFDGEYGSDVIINLRIVTGKH